MKLYKVKYTVTYETYVAANSEDDAVAKINEITDWGVENRRVVGSTEVESWSVTDELGELRELEESELDDREHTHKAGSTRCYQSAYELWRTW